jgi:hypothetical protein
MIRLTSFVFVISLVACNSQDGRILRPTPIPAARSSAIEAETQVPPGSAGEGAGSGASSGGGTGASTGTIACTTPQPAFDWICVNGDWVPPDHPSVSGSGESTGGESASSAGASGDSSAASSGVASGGCNTPQPVSNWICLNGGWLPPDHPLAAGPAGAGGASGNTGGSAGASPGATTNNCGTPPPASNWICLNGSWLPPDHPLATGSAGSGSTGGANGTGAASSGASGTCTTPDPFIGIPGMAGVCVGGAWFPSNHPVALALPVEDYTGVYTLIITADSCSPGFPEAAKRRVCTARIGQTGRNVRVLLSAADLLLGSGAFAGTVAPTGDIRFVISEADFYYYSGFDLVERFSDSSALIVSGAVRAKATGTGIFGTLSGEFALMQGVTVPFRGTLANCVSDVHRFDMVRQ